jgi:flagellar protein FliO/FliZ
MFHTLFVAALLGLSDRGSPAPADRVDQAAAADSVVAAAFAARPDATQPAPVPSPAGFGWQNLAAPALALLGLAGLAVGLARRRRSAPGSIRILEVAALGPRRSLVIADVLGDRLVLGVSEAGVTVLSTRPAPEEAATADLLSPPRPAIAPMGFFARLTGKPVVPSFGETLSESIEDQELRTKLAQGNRGTAP